MNRLASGCVACMAAVAVFAGCSLEDALTTHALAGTRPRGATPAEDDEARRLLAGDPKEQLEHRWVVDGIAARLAPLCDPLDVAAAPEVMTLPRVHHLHTPIAGRLRSGEGRGQ